MKKLVLILFLSTSLALVGMEEIRDMPAPPQAPLKKPSKFDYTVLIANGFLHGVMSPFEIEAVLGPCNNKHSHPDCKSYEDLTKQKLWPFIGSCAFVSAHHIIASSSAHDLRRVNKFYVKQIVKLALVYTSILSAIGTMNILDNASYDCKNDPSNEAACTISNNMKLWIPLFMEWCAVILNVVDLYCRR